MMSLMISCKKAGELIEKKAVDKLSMGELLQLKSHLILCGVCSRYEKFSHFIESYLLNTSNIPDKKNAKLPDHVRKNILKITSNKSS
ncbi:MAG: hypothetical protein WD048_15365 [Chitinophagales bacterium]